MATEAPPAAFRRSSLIGSVTILLVARQQADQADVQIDLRTLAHVPPGGHELVAEALETFAAKLRQDASPIVRPVP